MFEHFVFGTQVRAEGANSDEEGRVCPKETFNPTQQQQPRRRYRQQSLSPEIDDPISSDASSIECITRQLSNQHLGLDELTPLSASTCSSSSPRHRYQRLPSPADSRRATSSSVSSAMDSPLTVDEDYTPSPIPQDNKRLRRQISTKFHNNPLNTRAIQSLVGDMISTGDQCNVYTPPPATPLIIEADDNTDRMEFEMAMPLEVDSDPSDESLDRDLSLEQFLTMRRSGAPVGGRGIRKSASGLLRHRSMADTLLRCQNLVKSKPRMRKRPKMRQKPTGLPAATAAGSADAS